MPALPNLSLGVGGLSDSATVQFLAAGLARALARPGVRRQLLEDMRDSPFEYHALHARSYLLGERGAHVTRAIAEAAGVSVERVTAALTETATGSDFELVMPRYRDRRKWTSDATLDVFGTTRSAQEILLSPGLGTGYGADGRAVGIDLHGTGSPPYLVLRPATTSFGIDPEGARAATPARQGATIGFPDEHHIDSHSTGSPAGPSHMQVCDTDADPSCGSSGYITPPDPGYLILPSGRTFEQCMTYQPGAEIDGGCRQELAIAFRPRLVPNWDDYCNGREPAFTVRWGGWGSDEITIFYALSWYSDCGFRSNTFAGHHGDSEFIIVRVHPQPVARDHWYLGNVTLSAHFGWYIDNTWTGDPPAVEFRPGENLTRPRVYISWGKHGNYRDVGSCGRGAGYLDDCGRHTGPTDYELTYESGGIALGDMGTRAFPSPAYSGCHQSRRTELNLPGRECYWEYWSFAGWTNDYSSSATAYSELLSDFGF
jgi:hypothetical protein